MLSFLLITQAFAVEECESDPGYPFPQICCDPLPVDACAKQAVVSDMNDVFWISGYGVWQDWGGWDVTPTKSDDDPWNGLFRATASGASYDGLSNSDVTCAVTKSTGAIWCWGNVNGNTQITGRPTGGEPYSSLDTGNWGGSAGSTGIWVALDEDGVVKKWGKPNTTFDNNIPTASGFESVSIGYGPTGCAVDSAVAGVTCWGDNTHLITSTAPTTGNYAWVALSRFNALAVTTTGGVTMWGNTALQQYADFRTEVANAVAAVASPVVEAHLHESGKYAVLWHADRTLTIVEEGSGQDEIIEYAPCGSGSCPTGGVDNYHTNVQFRTAPRINENKAHPIVCGVVASDPGGLYTCGEVICWGESLHDTTAPQSIHECTTDEQAFCD